jgi:endonuclease/exonuclease/phosphatase family metal-dependent hydrolase
VVRLLTWNLNGLDERFLDERTEAAVFTAILGARLDQLEDSAPATPQPDVMVFQEVTPRMYHSHLKHHLPAGGYSLRPTDAPDRECFEVVAYRAPFTIGRYDMEPLARSRYSRFLHIVELTGDEGQIWQVLTGHFDSGTDATKIRVAQLRQVNARLAAQGVFAGDANLRKAEWLGNKEQLSMRDAWEVLGSPKASGVTWRREDLNARFDRVFIGTAVHPVAMHTYGAQTLPGLDVPISDHLGIVVELTAETRRKPERTQ